MLKKLALLVAVASAVTQAVRYWNEAGAKTTAQRKRHSRHEVQRWEDEGGNLPPAPEGEADKPRAAAAARRTQRARAGSSPVGRAARGASTSSASA